MRSFSVQRILANYADGMNVTFQADGRRLDSLIVFSQSAYLPVVALYAENLAMDCLGWTLAPKFTPDSAALFETAVEVPPVRVNVLSGSMVALIYLRAAAQCFEFEPGKQVDLYAIFERLSTPISNFISQSQSSPKAAAQ